MTNEELKKSLLAAPKSGFARLSAQERTELESHAAGYAAFIDACKTEREAVVWAVEQLQGNGFVELVPGMALKPGDKVYRNVHNKALMAAVIGTESMSEGVRICAAHIDSPRIDIKPNPLYEDSGLAYLKTHYYGGIKKYQWVTIPLALHGVVVRKDGTSVTITIGEDESDPILMITDLLPHLAADQMQKTAGAVIAGEQLNVLLGSEPLEGEGSELVKLHMMKLLNDKYGIIEEDFLSAELCIVPAMKCREMGLDRSMLAAYGHDDRVCAYNQFAPLLELDTPKHTAVCLWADKEEIGSVGITGMQSFAFETFVHDLCHATKASLYRCFEKSFCLSADVTNAYDPNFAETTERRNNSALNMGVGIFKYTGSRGKGGASDASAEAMGYVRNLLDKAGVMWQVCELGKVDQGGGGTVAAYMANRNIVTVDAGVPVLSMHAPMEIISKIDCYMSMRACKAVYED